MNTRDVIRARTEGERVTMSLTWNGQGYVLVGDSGGNRYRLMVDYPHPLSHDDVRALLHTVAREIEAWLY